jgi:hypothetical protein
VKTKALARDKGIYHALTWSGAREALCGFELHNFNKKISLEYYKSEHSDYEYVPPSDMYATCLRCVIAAYR